MKKLSIILVIMWMGVIFYFSNQEASVSTSHSNKVISILDSLSEDNNGLKDVLVGLYKKYGTSFVIRKGAHLTSYAILSILSFIMVYVHKSDIRLSVLYGFLISVIYAISDEIHQLFVPGRAGMVQDVFIDSIGAIIGLILIVSIFKVYKKVNMSYNNLSN